MKFNDFFYYFFPETSNLYGAINMTNTKNKATSTVNFSELKGRFMIH